MKATEYADPFRYWIVRDLVPWPIVRQARAMIPPADHPSWVRYDNELERGKWAMENPPDVAWQELLTRLEDADITALIGVSVVADRRGAGLHLMFPNGRLGTHVDYSLHPSGLERRANLILFLDDGDPRHGGGLMLCDSLGAPVATMYPKAGEAVLWECSDDTYHGVETLEPDSPPRVTAAMYYLAEPRPNCTRRRALFLPRR